MVQDLVVRTRAELDRVVDRLGGISAVEWVHAHADELTVETSDGPRVVGRVAVALAEAGITVEQITLRTPTLDDVFLEVTGERMRDPEEEEG